MIEYDRWSPVQLAPDYVDVRVLGASAETFAVPSGAQYVAISATGAVWVAYIRNGESEMVSGGDFAADTGWTKGGTWTIAGGVATRTASASGAGLTQANSLLVPGRSYTTSFTIAAVTAGSCTISLGGGTAGSARSTAATFTETLIAGSTNSLISINAGATFAGSVDDVSVAPIAIAPAADITGGGAPELINSGTYPVLRALFGISKLSIITNSGTPSVSLAYYA